MIQTRNSGKFNVVISWRGHKLRTEGLFNRYIPELRPTMHDPGSPPEGGDIDDLQIFMRHKRKDGRIVERLLSDDGMNLEREIEDTIYEALGAK